MSARRLSVHLVLLLVAAVCAVGFVSAPDRADARYGTGGSGAYLGAIDWFEWGTHLEPIPAGGTTRTNTRTVAGQTLATTCTISNLVDPAPLPQNRLRAYRPGTFSGDGLDDLYNIGGTGGNNQLVSGLVTGGARPQFDIACSVTLNGANVPLAGLVMADAEASIQGEYVQATAPAGAQWRLIDRIRTNGCTISGLAARTGQTLRFGSTEGRCSVGPTGVAFMEGATSASVELQGGGASAIALGVMLFNDFGDAPASYGDAGALYSPGFTGDTVPQGNNGIFGLGLSTPTQPNTRLGATIDSEGSSRNGNGTADGADEDAIGALDAAEVLPGQAYTLPNVACTGPGNVAGWIDWNRNGSFDAGERAADRPACTGASVSLSWTVPADVVRGLVNMRLRIGPSAASVAEPSGMTTSGEVEDHQFVVNSPADFGDAPAPYPAGINNVPAFDEATGTAPLMLGARVDRELSTVGTDAAQGDDEDGVDDEDGLSEPLKMITGLSTTLTVTATNNTATASTLVGFADLDGSDSWTVGVAERSNLVTLPANSGTQSYQLTFPPATTADDTYARIRVLTGNQIFASPTQGTANPLAGETEDYRVDVQSRGLEITKSSDATAATRSGDTVTYTVRATNTGDGDYTAADPARVVDSLAGVLDDASYTNDAASDRGGDPVLSQGSLRWSGALPGGESVTLTYSVIVGHGGDGEIDNIAFQPLCDPASADCDLVVPECVDGADPDTGLACAEESFELPRLTILKTADRTELPAVGETTTYTVTVTNDGPGDFTAEDPATFSDDLSEVLDDADLTAGPTASVGTANATGDGITWSGALAAGDSATIEYTVTYDGDGDQLLANEACIPAEDALDPQDLCGSVSVPGSGLDVDKVADPASGTAVGPGDTVSYTLRFTNVGNTPAVVETIDDRSGILDDATSTGEVVAGAGLTATVDGDDIDITGTVPVGATRTVTYSVIVGAVDGPGDQVLRNTLACQPGDPDSCEPETTEHPVRSLDIEKTSDRTPATRIGDTLTYTVRATAFGEGDYTALDPATVSDDLSGVLDDATLVGDASADRDGVVSLADELLRWRGALAAGQSVELTYRVELTGDGDLEVRNVAFAGEGDSPACNPPDEDGLDPETGVACDVSSFGLPDIVDTKSVDPADRTVVGSGQELTYTLTFRNDGTAPGLVDREDVVAGVLDDAELVTAPTASGPALTVSAIAGGRFSIGGTLAPDQEVTVSYTVRVKPAGQRAPDGDDVLGNFLVDAGDPAPSTCADDDADCTVNTIPRVTDSKSVQPTDGTSVHVGGRVTYALTFTNEGTAPGEVDREDVLAGVLDDAALVEPPTSDDPALTVSDVVDGRFSVSGELAPDQAVTVTYVVRVRALARRGDSILANALVDPGEEPLEDCAADDPDCTVNRVTDVEAQKASDADREVEAGDAVTYTLTFRNRGGGPGELAYSDDLSDVLDDADLVDGPTASSPDVEAVLDGDRLSVGGVLEPDQVATVTYTVQLRDRGDRGNDQLVNFLVRDGDAVPESCSSGSELCTASEVGGIAEDGGGAGSAQGDGLPDTGSPIVWWHPALGLGLLTLGVFFAAVSSRRRPQGLHRAA